MRELRIFTASANAAVRRARRLGGRWRRAFVTALVALAIGGATAVPATPLPAHVAVQVTVDESHFDWTNLEGDRALFEWSARVVNAGTRAFRVQVALELLDDDDQVILVDEVTIEVAAGQSRTVRNDGSMPYDSAANVVQSRWRVDPEPTNDRSKTPRQR